MSFLFILLSEIKVNLIDGKIGLCYIENKYIIIYSYTKHNDYIYHIIQIM